jgi:hypothetical protein
MTSRRAIFHASLGLLLGAAIAAAAGSRVQRPNNLRAGAVTTSANAPLRIAGGRNASQRADPNAAKFDAALAELARHPELAQRADPIGALRALNPAARFKLSVSGGGALVLVDAVTRGDPHALGTALSGLGLEAESVYANDVGGWLPVSRLSAAAARPEVSSLRAAMPHTRAGAVESQGDYVTHSAAVRSAFPTLDGAGVTIGVLSDSFNCFADYAALGYSASGYTGYSPFGYLATAQTDISTGDLPSTVKLVSTTTDGQSYPGEGPCDSFTPGYSASNPFDLPLTDEGRAMLQIVHDVAPGASLVFHSAENSEADFANGIAALAAAGAKVIADDVGYYDEPFYQDGLVAEAVDSVEADGVAYFAAAGNDGNATGNETNSAYENTSPHFNAGTGTGLQSGETLLNFDTTGATSTSRLPISIGELAPGEYVAIVVEWDQPYVTGAPTSGGATSRLDVCLSGAPNSLIVQNYDGDTTSCTGLNAVGSDPNQILIVGNPTTGDATGSGEGYTNTAAVTLSIGLGSGSSPPGRIIVAVETDGIAGQAITSFGTNSPTLQGHPGASGAAAVGAAFYFQTPACGTSPAVLEPYSSQGGYPILFDSSGARLATPVVRNKPDFVGPDGGNNTFLGYPLDGVTTNGVVASAGGELSTTVAQCQTQSDPASAAYGVYPSFFGTSAATPHAAAIAALMLQANPSLTPAQIYTALRGTALPMGSVAAGAYNYDSGAGFIQADKALATLAPGAPSLTLAATSIAQGSSTTITWAATPTATACAASGGWTSVPSTSGSQQVAPTSLGTTTYTLSCSNSAGSSAATSVSLTVTAAGSGSSSSSSGGATNSGGHGGGALDADALALLAGLALFIRARRR